MRSFVLKLASFFLIQAGLLLLLVATSDLSHEQNYLAAIIEKHAWLERAPSPRLILVGGSNLAFGIDSERLGQAMGRAVVNLGLAGGFGLEFMLNEAAPSLRQGDMVILSLEYDLFSGGYNPLNLRQVLEYRPASLRSLRPHQWKRVLVDGGLSIVGGIVRRHLNGWLASSAGEEEIDDIYRRSGFNRYGDMTSHYGKTSRLQAEAPVDFRSQWIPINRVLQSLRHFTALCARRGASCYFTCPPLPRECLQEGTSISDQILAKLATVPGLVILDSPRDQAYPGHLFFDTGYHLLREGVMQRTDRLIRELQAAKEGPRQ